MGPMGWQVVRERIRMSPPGVRSYNEPGFFGVSSERRGGGVTFPIPKKPSAYCRTPAFDSAAAGSGSGRPRSDGAAPKATVRASDRSRRLDATADAETRRIQLAATLATQERLANAQDDTGAEKGCRHSKGGQYAMKYPVNAFVLAQIARYRVQGRVRLIDFAKGTDGPLPTLAAEPVPAAFFP